MSSETATTTSKVEVKWVEDDLFLGTDESGHSVVFDSSLSVALEEEGAPKGNRPMNALLTSLGACSGHGRAPRYS